jgi:hypothetical protein
MWQSPEVIKIHTGNMTSKCPNYSCASPKGALSQDAAKLMVFKLISAASRTWRRLQGENQLPKIIQGVKFRDGIEVSVPTSQSAA